MKKEEIELVEIPYMHVFRGQFKVPKYINLLINSIELYEKNKESIGKVDFYIKSDGEITINPYSNINGEFILHATRLCRAKKIVIKSEDIITNTVSGGDYTFYLRSEGE